ncbi:MAG: hypothetical protein MI747_06745 [Desulfobacterales bacterium]|nr:hypothetical protein [Desulfobacterales bacterium]
MGAAWVVFIFAIFIFHRARPEFHTLFDDFYGLDLRRVWDNRFLQYLLYCIIVGLAISLSSLLLGIFRARRKADRKKQLMILATLYTILAILAWRLI